MTTLRTLMFIGLLLAIATPIGCQVTVRRMSIWTFPVMTFPARSVEVGDEDQVLVPAYKPDGNSFCVGMRFVHINPENKNQLTASNPIKWPGIIKREMAE